MADNAGKDCQWKRFLGCLRGQRFADCSSRSTSLFSSKKIDTPRRWHETTKFRLISWLFVGVGGGLATVFGMTSTFTILHHERFLKHVTDRPRNVALMTAMNHTSTLDEPVLTCAITPFSIVSNTGKVRWAVGAEDILFTNPIFSFLFHHLRAICVRRGGGLNQKGVNDAIHHLDCGHWVNMFPEGKVCVEQIGYFHPGIGKMIADSCLSVTVLPIYHRGMHTLKPYHTHIPRIGKNIVVSVGEPVNLDDILEEYRAARDSLSDEEKRKYYLKIANRIHDAVVELSIEVDQELQRKRELE